MGVLKKWIREMLDKGEIIETPTDEGKILKFKDKGKRERTRTNHLITDFNIKTLFNLHYLIAQFVNEKLNVKNISRPVLVRIIKKNLDCSVSTAYDYANFLIWLFWIMK